MLPVRVTLNNGLVAVGSGGSKCSPERTPHALIDLKPQNARACSSRPRAGGIGRTIVDDQHSEPEGDQPLDTLCNRALLVERRDNGEDGIAIACMLERRIDLTKAKSFRERLNGLTLT